MPPRVLLVATTTGYQTRAFGEAAGSLNLELVFATDRCALLDDPWRDSAIPVRFHQMAASVERIVEADARQPFAAVIAVGDRPATLAAHASEALGLAGHSSDGAEAARNKLLTRERLRQAALAGAPLYGRARFVRCVNACGTGDFSGRPQTDRAVGEPRCHAGE